MTAVINSSMAYLVKIVKLLMSMLMFAVASIAHLFCPRGQLNFLVTRGPRGSNDRGGVAAARVNPSEASDVCGFGYVSNSRTKGILNTKKKKKTQKTKHPFPEIISTPLRKNP